VIRYSLCCAEGHEFESWFRDSEAYDRQAAQAAIVCPVCGSARVAKAIMAPNVARGARMSAPAEDESAALRAMIGRLRAALAAATEDVGDAFPEEARRMCDGEAEQRAIRGRASLEEAKALIEDGIDILSIPGPPLEGH
jgi:hypothetical protein